MPGRGLTWTAWWRYGALYSSNKCNSTKYLLCIDTKPSHLQTSTSLNIKRRKRKRYLHFILPGVQPLPANMCPSNKRTCTPFSQESGEKRNWAKFFLPDDKTCKTRYVAESSSDFQFLVYCWNSNGKSQPEISLGRLSTSRERKLSLALKQKISERTSTLLFPGIDFHIFFLHMCVLRSNIIWT